MGYYVNNEYDSEELNNEPPAKPAVDRVRRNILAEKPRVTRFAIKWYAIGCWRNTWPKTDHQSRDSEDSAPAEYPPEQPGVDQEEDDGTAYGAEEAEMQAAVEKELAEFETENVATNGDADMGGTDQPHAAPKEDDEASEAGSEDLEADSSDDDDDDEDEEEAGGNEGDEDMEMGDGEEKPAATNGETKSATGQQQPEVMVH